MDVNRQVHVNGSRYDFSEESDVNLTLAYENDNWGGWHIVREFVSNALDSVHGDSSKVFIRSGEGFVTISDTGDGYPLVYAKRIGATNKRDDTNYIGSFGEGVKLSLLSCVREGIGIRLLSRDWMIEPKIKAIEGQEVLIYDIFITDTPILGTAVIIEAVPEITDIVDNLGLYFLHFRNQQDCLYGDIGSGIYPLTDKTARLYNKGVFVKEITALYSYGISLEELNRDRDVISHQDVAQAVRRIWENADNPCLIRPLITAGTKDLRERDELVELYYSLYPKTTEPWAMAFSDLFGEKSLLYTDGFAEREAVALGYEVVKVDYRISDILRRAGIRNDTESLSDDYEFTFAGELNQDEASMLERVRNLAALVCSNIPEGIKAFTECTNNETVRGLYNPDTGQLYIKQSVLSLGLEEALNVYLHEVNHHITGADDFSRSFADNLSRMLSELLLKYAAEAGTKSAVRISGSELFLPNIFPLGMSSYANIAAIGNKLIIYDPATTVEVKLPFVLATPVLGIKKVTLSSPGAKLRLPSKLAAMLSYINPTESLDCVVKINAEP